MRGVWVVKRYLGSIERRFLEKQEKKTTKTKHKTQNKQLTKCMSGESKLDVKKRERDECYRHRSASRNARFA